MKALNINNHALWLMAGVVGLASAVLVKERRRSARTKLPNPALQYERTRLPKASVMDSVAVLLEVFVPTIAKGVIIRRAKVVELVERLDLDRRAIRRMQVLRSKYGDGPLMLRLPLRSQAVILAPEHVHRVLEQTSEPFATASSEKRAALSHFEPRGSLLSHGEARADRRRFNEVVLEAGNPTHHLADRFIPVVEEEADRIMTTARQVGELNWDLFAQGWFRMVRRVIFGDGASNDHELSSMMADLRRSANWAFLHPQKKDLQKAFLAHLQVLLGRAEHGSLAFVVAQTRKTENTMPHHQVPQWLFAFDPAGMATFRALALISTHPEHEAMVREEIENKAPGQLSLLRATVLESLRLWPTTPMVLRQTTSETHWENGSMPAHTGVAIYAPYFHRDDQRRIYANRFAPELWLKKRNEKDWPLIPFSGGPAICPARHLVQMLSSAMLARVLKGRQIQLQPANCLDPEKLPATLNHYSLRFTFSE